MKLFCISDEMHFLVIFYPPPFLPRLTLSDFANLFKGRCLFSTLNARISTFFLNIKQLAKTSSIFFRGFFKICFVTLCKGEREEDGGERYGTLPLGEVGVQPSRNFAH